MGKRVCLIMILCGLFIITGCVEDRISNLIRPNQNLVNTNDETMIYDASHYDYYIITFNSKDFVKFIEPKVYKIVTVTNKDASYSFEIQALSIASNSYAYRNKSVLKTDDNGIVNIMITNYYIDDNITEVNLKINDMNVINDYIVGKALSDDNINQLYKNLNKKDYVQIYKGASLIGNWIDKNDVAEIIKSKAKSYEIMGKFKEAFSLYKMISNDEDVNRISSIIDSLKNVSDYHFDNLYDDKSLFPNLVKNPYGFNKGSAYTFGFIVGDKKGSCIITPSQWIDNKSCLANIITPMYLGANREITIYLDLGKLDASDFPQNIDNHILQYLGTYQYTSVLGNLITVAKFKLLYMSK